MVVEYSMNDIRLPSQVERLVVNAVIAFDKKRPLEKELHAAHNEMAERLVANGLGQSAFGLGIFVKQTKQYLEDRARYVSANLQKAIKSCQIDSYPELSAELKAFLFCHMGQSLKGATAYFEHIRPAFNGSPESTKQVEMEFMNVLTETDVDLDYFCADYETTERNRKRMTASELNDKNKQEAEHKTINIENFAGVFGNVTNSQVAVYDYGTINKLMIDRKVPTAIRRELEDLVEELEIAPAEKKKAIAGKMETWLSKHKEGLGTTAEVIGRFVGGLVKEAHKH